PRQNGAAAAFVQLSLGHGPSGLGATVAAGEFLNPSRCIDELLFAGEKRMTSGANTDFNVLPR
ncbi:MAG: hypothetical protein QOH39_1040, partial [Verrucomicrobiota bacterium]